MGWSGDAMFSECFCRNRRSGDIWTRECLFARFFSAEGVQHCVGREGITLLTEDATEKRLIDCLGAGKIVGVHLHMKWARRYLERAVLLWMGSKLNWNVIEV